MCLACGLIQHKGPFQGRDKTHHICEACGEEEEHNFSVRREWEDLGGWDADFAYFDEEVVYRTCRDYGYEDSRITGRRLI
jgi:hypothetical protein